MDVREIVVAEAGKAAPLAGGVSWYWLGLPMEKWLTIVLLVYGVLQIGFLLRDKVWRERVKGKGRAGSTRAVFGASDDTSTRGPKT